MTEDIYLIFTKFSSIKEVKDLKKNEDIKEYTKMNSCFIIPMLFLQANRALNIEYLWASK